MRKLPWQSRDKEQWYCVPYAKRISLKPKRFPSPCRKNKLVRQDISSVRRDPGRVLARSWLTGRFRSYGSPYDALLVEAISGRISAERFSLWKSFIWSQLSYYRCIWLIPIPKVCLILPVLGLAVSFIISVVSLFSAVMLLQPLYPFIRLIFLRFLYFPFLSHNNHF